ncbi:hypothetical protein BGZ98_005479 [Dissophora globulifera]|nr:hypothetical protein BGZ98_005479 [Dissophora globulifera]
MTWIPNSASSSLALAQPHMAKASSSTSSSAATASASFSDLANNEQILTAPELRSMDHNDIHHDNSIRYGNGAPLFQASEDYSYMQRDTQYQVAANQYHPYDYRHSYPFATTTQQELGSSRYMMQLADRVLNSSVDSVIELSASSRGVPPAMARRARSLDVYPTFPGMFSVMETSLPYGSYYGESSSLPGSPSSAASASPVPNNFVPHLMVDGHPHPLYTPAMPIPSSGSEKHGVASAASSPSPCSALSTSFQSTTSTFSQHSSASTCNSPLLSGASPNFSRKRFSTDSAASQDTLCDKSLGASAAKRAKHRYTCHFPNCDRIFSRPYNLKSHSLTHDANRPHACGKCAKSFARIHDRDRHMNSHMPLKPHVCIVCEGRFARQDAVIRHLKLSNETNACAWILKSKNISFRDAAAGRITRETLGDEAEIRESLEAMEEVVRRTRATRTMEMMGGSLPADFDQL